MPLILPGQADKSGLIQPEQSLLIHYLRFIVRVRSACGHLLYLYFEDRQEYKVLEVVRGQ